MISPAAATSCCKLLVVECTASKVWISGASSRSFSMGSLLSDARCRSNCNSLKSGRESKSSSGTRKSDDLARDWEIWRLSKLHRMLPVHIDDELRSWFTDLTCSTTITKFTVPPLRKISTPSQSYCAKWLLLYKDCRILFPAVSICATYWKTYWNLKTYWKYCQTHGAACYNVASYCRSHVHMNKKLVTRNMVMICVVKNIDLG